MMNRMIQLSCLCVFSHQVGDSSSKSVLAILIKANRDFVSAPMRIL
jgi:hypothetical protein